MSVLVNKVNEVVIDGPGGVTSRLEKLPDPGLSLPIQVPDPEQTGEPLDNPQWLWAECAAPVARLGYCRPEPLGAPASEQSCSKKWGNTIMSCHPSFSL